MFSKKMALKIKEFDVNYITAVGRKSVNGLKFANFRYKNSDKFPRIIVYGGMRVEQGQFGNYFESDIKDDETGVLEIFRGNFAWSRWWAFGRKAMEYKIAIDKLRWFLYS